MEDLLHSQKEEQDARIALLRHYSSKSIAHGTYIITVAIGIFGFLGISPLLEFPDETFKALAITFILSGFFTVGTHLVGRTFFWGSLASNIFFVKPLSYEDAAKRLKHYSGDLSSTYLIRLHFACSDLVKSKNKRRGWFSRLKFELVIVFLLLWMAFFVLYFLWERKFVF